ncbi:MAG: HlyC/CorC family transporter [Chloroflexi bacterium]|nr:MAG: HlyC/CorC family transporter [Chloroflexota bacterium]
MLSLGGLLAVLVLVFVNACFVAAEYALVTVRKTRVDQMVAERRPGARIVAEARERLDSYIAACQLGITMASLALGWVGEPALAHIIEPLTGWIGSHVVSVIISFAIITAIEVTAGELAPKSAALQHPERTALILVPVLRLFLIVFRPVIAVLNAGGQLVARMIGAGGLVSESSHVNAEELRLVVQASAEAGAIDSGEQILLDRVLRFGDLNVANIMVPRTEVIALSMEMTPDEVREIVRQHNYSRYPVYRKDIDDLIGVLHVRDLMLDGHSPTIGSLLHEPIVVPSHIELDRLVTAMRQRREHFAIAVDEFGGTDGIVTLEDVLEAILGDVSDDDEGEQFVQRRPDGSIRIDGLDSVDVLDELLGTAADEGPYNTVGGYVMERVGRIPEVGDSVELGGYILVVTEMDEMRIAFLEALPIPDRVSDASSESA